MRKNPTSKTPTRETLNDLVEFDSPFQILSDGSMVRPCTDHYAPSAYDYDGLTTPEIDSSAWSFVDGYSGQHHYSGPAMHASEHLGGSMADYVIATPGVYCIVAIHWLPSDDGEELEAESWALLEYDNEELHNPREVATCGNCERSWCELCDPTPSALCHYCHGRGHSIARILPN